MQSQPSGTVTFLFTDIESSTRRWQDDPEAMRALLVEHDAILRDAIDKHRGQFFEHTGDGVEAVFSSASDAVNAASTRRLGRPMCRRCGWGCTPARPSSVTAIVSGRR